MMEVILNETIIDAINYNEETIKDPASNRTYLKIKFKFLVPSDDYHDITTLLYKNDFHVQVPEQDLTFEAMIHNYSTSITNLYNTGKIGTFYLELAEKE